MGEPTRGPALTTVHVPVLMYHSVAVAASAAFEPYVIHPDRFRDHLVALVQHGYRTCTVSEYVESRAHNPSSLERTVVLTFDDGFVDFYDAVLPALVERRLSATLYVPSAFVGRTSRWLAREGEADRPVMSWAQLVDLVAAGIEVGSHSRTHADLDLLSGAALAREVGGSKRELEDGLQAPVRSFAYPFGHHTAVVRGAVRAAGYTSGVAVRDLSSGSEDRFALSRWTVSATTTTDQLLDVLAVRSGPAAIARSQARALVSFALRRTGVRRHEPATVDAP